MVRVPRNVAENLNRPSRVHECYRQTTDRQTTDGRAIAYSEREREFTFANETVTAKCRVTHVQWSVHSTWWSGILDGDRTGV